MALKVVLLAGSGGKQLQPMTERLPKCLLPVADRPLVSYQLEMLEKAGLNDILMITNEGCVSGIREIVKEKFPKLQVDLVSLSEDMNSVEALKQVKHKLKSDSCVISGDIILDSRAIWKLADLHREKEAMVSILFSSTPTEEGAPDKKKKKPTNTTDYIALAEKNREVVAYFSGVDLVDENIKFRKQLIGCFSQGVTVTSELIDTYVYIFSPEALERLDDQQFESLRGDFVPYLCRLQFRSEKKIGESTEQPQDDIDTEKGGLVEQKGKAVGRSLAKVFYQVLEDKQYYVRVNNMDNYMRANKEVATGNTGYLPPQPKRKDNFIAEGANIPVKSTVGSECVLGLSELGERTSVKKSVIGNHCKIGNNVRIVQSVLMDHVVVQDNSTINGSVLCPHSTVGERATVSGSIIGYAVKVSAESEIKNEKLSDQRFE